MSAIDISDRMAKIRSLFEDTLQRANEQPDNIELFRYLDTTDEQFRSIAYEGASMSRGLSDFMQGDVLVDWPMYRDETKPHAVQVHIGLGWAVSQRQLALSPILKDIAPIYHARVLDGFGYYDGTFRHRTSIRDKVISDQIKGTDMHGYDQGIGRSLWYASKGSLSRLAELVNGFDTARRSDLWRGIGIAMAYVGAYDEALLLDVLELAGEYKLQLSVGAAFLIRSRYEADTVNEESAMACRVWCRLSADETIAVTHETEPLSPTSGDEYINWVNGMSEVFSRSFVQ